MNVTIQIHYISSTRVLQRGSFPLRGKKPEQVALQFWKEIKRTLPFGGELEKVICNGEDITGKVKELNIINEGEI